MLDSRHHLRADNARETLPTRTFSRHCENTELGTGTVEVEGTLDQRALTKVDHVELCSVSKRSVWVEAAPTEKPTAGASTARRAQATARRTAADSAVVGDRLLLQLYEALHVGDLALRETAARRAAGGDNAIQPVELRDQVPHLTNDALQIPT